LAGIYIHIPFCKQACSYCNFHFTTSLRNKTPLVNALAWEAAAERDYLQGETIDTIYFGGGTPSLLSQDELILLTRTIRDNYLVAADAELTLEANPDDISRDKLSGWKDAGINRLSIGVQSFFEEELRWMNRAHNSRQAVESLELALHQFDNITIDLIYGSPLLTDEMWKENVEKATALGIPHLSCYALTVEEKTPLYKMIHTRQTADMDTDKQARQFLQLMEWLREKGYEHYEVSNFAQPGYRSRHNSSYWKGEKYLGLGPSAHSYNGRERRWNISNNNIYLEGTRNSLLQRETESLTREQQLNEYIMISLRTSEGMNLERIEQVWGTKERDRIERLLKNFPAGNFVLPDPSTVSLTDEGMLMADGMARDLFAE
jgi:oxygen-independent coproporphyrinogen-3 oxidase